jgi:hypothetical protein
MAEDFDEPTSQNSKSEVERLLTELNDSIIGFENYKKFFEKVQNSDRVIITQIENLTRDYKEQKERYDEITKKDSFKQLREDGFIQIEVFDLVKKMHRNILEAFNWKTLQEEMYNIVFNKLYQVLDDARALDIKRDALKEMREMESERQKMFVDIIENMAKTFNDTVGIKLQNYDEKLFNLVMMNDEEHRKDRRDIFNSLIKVMDITGVPKQKQSNILQEISMDELPRKIDKFIPEKPKPENNEEYNKVWNKVGKEVFDSMDEEDSEDDGNDDVRRRFSRREEKGGVKK